MTIFNIFNLKTALIGTLTGSLFLGTGIFSPAQSVSLEGLDSEAHSPLTQDLHAQWSLPSGSGTIRNSTGGGVRGNDDNEWEENWEEEWQDDENTVGQCNSEIKDETVDADLEDIDADLVPLEEDTDIVATDVEDLELEECNSELEAEAINEEDDLAAESLDVETNDGTSNQ